MDKEISEIKEWIIRRQEGCVERCVSAESQGFGCIEMANGKKAEIQVILEMDEDEWIKDYKE